MCQLAERDGFSVVDFKVVAYFAKRSVGLGWLGSDKLLVGLRSDAGTEGAVLDVGSGKLRRLNKMADQASSDGRFSLGNSGDENSISIVRIADGHRIFLRKGACCPDWNR